VDIGGATTDVYSCADGRPRTEHVVMRGVPEPFEKRSVEADMGTRHTLRHLMEKLDLEAMAANAGPNVSVKTLKAWVDEVTAHPDRVPSTPPEERMDGAFAAAACDTAVERHFGRLEEAFTPEGRIFLQEGKDLGGVGWVVGTGGPVANSRHPDEILAGCVRHPGSPSLKPLAPALVVDRRYLLWAMGLLAETEPAAALMLMKRHLTPADGATL
jgi:uncharacterized protein (TIGR01319 family)